MNEAGVLDSFYQALYGAVLALPLWYAKLGALLIFALILAVVWLLPREYVYGGQESDERRSRLDLRLLATGLLLLQLLLYWLF